MVCGSRRGMVSVRRGEFVIGGAGLAWPAVTGVPGSRAAVRG